MRVLLADPPAYTPPYARSLAAALAAAGADVELVTSRFRFGAVERPHGYVAREWFYPVSSRMGSSRARLAVKALEHPLGMARLAAHRPDVLHLQWFGAPEADRWLFRPRSPAVFTAHDIIPRRTAARTGLRVAGARLLVAGDPRIPLDGLQLTAGDRAEWRLGFLPDREIRRALSEATVALFPYRSEIDVSGALLQVLGAGVPAIVYDIGGLGEVVGRFGAGTVVEPGDVGGMALALERLLDDTELLARARVGAEAAREELSWEASAIAHLELYRELL